ncbi:hypothetical protein [Clostridium estertheticum]|uniref:hypothetical protein n=1 Tax=Clostridium estertheticum TaxID=238834 RepID=UPI001C0AC44F|nr:hypothetical protein [Clostridium estertheticum]MBU3173395.1 hypothetical protein [Clostridium estertheticum]
MYTMKAKDDSFNLNIALKNFSKLIAISKKCFSHKKMIIDNTECFISINLLDPNNIKACIELGFSEVNEEFIIDDKEIHAYCTLDITSLVSYDLIKSIDSFSDVKHEQLYKSIINSIYFDELKNIIINLNKQIENNNSETEAVF